MNCIFFKVSQFCAESQTFAPILAVNLTVFQENHQRVNIFFDYAKKTKNTAWSYFLPMLNRQDPFTVHMVGLDRVI